MVDLEHGRYFFAPKSYGLHSAGSKDPAGSNFVGFFELLGCANAYSFPIAPNK